MTGAAGAAAVSLRLDAGDSYQGRHSLKLTLPSAAGLLAIPLATLPTNSTTLNMDTHKGEGVGEGEAGGEGGNFEKSVRFAVRTSPRGGRVSVACGQVHAAGGNSNSSATAAAGGGESVRVGSSWQVVEFTIACQCNAGKGTALHVVIEQAAACATATARGRAEASRAGAEARGGGGGMSVWIDAVSVLPAGDEVK